MDWPESLVAELAERRCLMFIGSGASAACTTSAGQRPPAWRGLLDGALPLVRSAETRRVAELLIERDQLLDAAEVIFSGIEPAEIRTFLRASLLNSSLSAI